MKKLVRHLFLFSLVFALFFAFADSVFAQETPNTEIRNSDLQLIASGNDNTGLTELEIQRKKELTTAMSQDPAFNQKILDASRSGEVQLSAQQRLSLQLQAQQRANAARVQALNEASQAAATERQRILDEIAAQQNNETQRVIPTGMFSILLNGSSLSGMVAAAVFTTVLAAYIELGGAGCWFCPLFTAAFDAINTIATQIYNRLSITMILFIGGLGALWLAWIVLQHFLTLNEPNVGEFMTKLFRAIAKMVVGAAILWSPVTFIFDYTVNPVIIFSGALSSQIISSAGLGSGYMVTMNRAGTGIQRSQTALCRTTPASERQGRALSTEAYDTIMCMLRTMSLEMIIGMASGMTVMIHSFTAGWFGLPNFYITIVGLLMWIGYIGLFFIFPFKLIDILVRVGFVIALMPIYVLFWVFPGTSGYTKKGFDILITSMFTLVALSVLMVIAIQLISSVDVSNQSVIGLIGDLAKGQINKAVDRMSFSGTKVFVTLAAVLIAWKVLNMAPALGEVFGGITLGQGVGDSIQKSTMKMGKKAAGLATKAMGAGASKAANGAIGAATGGKPQGGGSSGGGSAPASAPKQYSVSGGDHSNTNISV